MASAHNPEDYPAAAQLTAMGWQCGHYRYSTQTGLHWRLCASKQSRVMQRDVLLSHLELRRAVSPPAIKLAKLTAAWESMLECELRWQQECG